MIGGQVGIAGHLKIGNNVKIYAQTGVSKDIKDGEIIFGTPAIKARDFHKSYIHFKNLPKIVSKVNQIAKDLKTQTKNNE
jgi:UDP-3-O-[3-hydroxymyristoyl] glucosamine N-acyltransferase